MKKIQRYELDFDKAYRYFIYSMYDINRISSKLLEVINFRDGNFFTLLPKNARFENIYQFRWGGLLSPIRNEISQFIFNIIKSNQDLSCIFDSDDECSKIDQSQREGSNYFCFGEEVYYVPDRSGLSRKAILNYMDASNSIWHSLCVITKFGLNDLKIRNFSTQTIDEICLNTQFIMSIAYDAEGYVFWERKGK